MTNLKSTDERLSQLYHKGQDQIWDGKKYLQECLDRHNGINLSDEKKVALRNIFAVILWGELAAWKISARLSTCLDNNHARMAATSQAHDEARHFYVMQDYLGLLGEVPQKMDKYADRFLDSIMRADSSAKMLLGMQLMVEPLALTLFKLIRELNIEPVLSDLLLMYEKDEARHVALGTLYLPVVMEKMSVPAKTDLLVWQFREYMRQFDMLKSLADDFRQLDIDPKDVFALARKKQVKAIELLAEEMGKQYPLMETMLRIIDFRSEINFPEEETDYLNRVKNAVSIAFRRD